MLSGIRTFSSSKACLALILSCLAFFNISSSSNSNFRFTPLPSLAAESASTCPLLFPFLGLPSSPIVTFSKSSTALPLSSSTFSLSCSSSSLRRLSSSFSSLLISCRCASRLLTAHSRQNISPLEEHATGSRAI